MFKSYKNVVISAEWDEHFHVVPQYMMKPKDLTPLSPGGLRLAPMTVPKTGPIMRQRAAEVLRKTLKDLQVTKRIFICGFCSWRFVSLFFLPHQKFHLLCRICQAGPKCGDFRDRSREMTAGSGGKLRPLSAQKTLGTRREAAGSGLVWMLNFLTFMKSRLLLLIGLWRFSTEVCLRWVEVGAETLYIWFSDLYLHKLHVTLNSVNWTQICSPCLPDEELSLLLVLLLIWEHGNEHEYIKYIHRQPEAYHTFCQEFMLKI